MNIFYLDRDPCICASYHCDKHVLKMILEYAQLLSTAHHILNPGPHNDNLYKATHKNHPSAIWVRSNLWHYDYTYALMGYLMLQYTLRYKKLHATEQRLFAPLADHPRYIANKPWIDPPQCMPDDCKQTDTVQAYRLYYAKYKANMCKWKDSYEPTWFKDLTK